MNIRGYGTGACLAKGQVFDSPQASAGIVRHHRGTAQVILGNIREQSIMSIWERSPILTKLRQRDLLKGECGVCKYKLTCSGCRGRAYEETDGMMATDPGCWLAMS